MDEHYAKPVQKVPIIRKYKVSKLKLVNDLMEAASEITLQ
jgi:hypothetical protein